jgi:hypothetical protein
MGIDNSSASTFPTPQPSPTLRRRHLPPLLALSTDPQSTSSLLHPLPRNPTLSALHIPPTNNPALPYKDLTPFSSIHDKLLNAGDVVDSVEMWADWTGGDAGLGQAEELAGRREVCEEVVVMGA